MKTKRNLVRRWVAAAAILAVTVLLCSGCEDSADIHIVNGGVVIDPDAEFDYESYFAQIYRESEPYVTTPPETTAPSETTAPPEATAPSDTVVPPDTRSETVYWTKNGEVWHVNGNCSSLSRSKNISSGNIALAESSGKMRACKKCSE